MILQEYYEGYYQGAVGRYEEYMAAARRDPVAAAAAVAYPAAGTAVAGSTEYDMYARRSPNSASIAHYGTLAR